MTAAREQAKASLQRGRKASEKRQNLHEPVEGQLDLFDVPEPRQGEREASR